MPRALRSSRHVSSLVPPFNCARHITPAACMSLLNAAAPSGVDGLSAAAPVSVSAARASTLPVELAATTFKPRRFQIVRRIWLSGEVRRDGEDARRCEAGQLGFRLQLFVLPGSLCRLG